MKRTTECTPAIRAGRLVEQGSEPRGGRDPTFLAEMTPLTQPQLTGRNDARSASSAWFGPLTQ